MRQLSRIHAGNSKTDVRDAYIIAYAGKYLPESRRQVDRVEEAFIQLKVLNGADEDLTRSYTRLINKSVPHWLEHIPNLNMCCVGR